MKASIPAGGLPAGALPAPLLIGSPGPADGYSVHPEHRFEFLGAPTRDFEFRRRDRWSDS